MLLYNKKKGQKKLIAFSINDDLKKYVKQLK